MSSFDDYLAAPGLAEFQSRLLARYQPGHWIGGWRKVFGPVAESDTHDPDLLEHHPPHFLVALWQPVSLDAPILPRWPYKTTLVAPDAGAAARELFMEVPEFAGMWLANDHIDWQLMAEIVMLSERWLQPFHYRELQAFVRMESAQTNAKIALHYGEGQADHEGFLQTRAPQLAE